MDKPEALRLAEFCDGNVLYQPAAAELRRLHAENALLGNAADKLRMAWRDEVHCLMQDKRQLIAQRDALLEALKLARPYINPNTLDGYYAEVKADAAINAVEGENHAKSL